ncbi:unnamed protein product [Prorocentrum cordatum]|uniref:Phospholipase B-like n=1 Tax=Prorocentrum cordatum TaxID=2364126 RepID=A0ABN9TJT1_9DINO|nr:unnamed protein product [Polarella glacialis]
MGSCTVMVDVSVPIQLGSTDSGYDIDIASVDPYHEYPAPLDTPKSDITFTGKSESSHWNICWKHDASGTHRTDPWSTTVDDYCFYVNGLCFLWASPCSGGCSQIDVCSYAWFCPQLRYATEAEFSAALPTLNANRTAFFHKCAATVLDPYFWHCDYANTFVRVPDNHWNELVLVCSLHGLQQLCSGRVDSLYAALVTEQYAGASYREQNGSTEKKVLRAEGGTEPGAATELSSWTTQTAWGDEAGVKSAIENYSSIGEPWFTVQSTEAAKWADTEGANASSAPRKLWSELYLMNPWTKYNNDGSGQLGMSWTTPVVYCGNYSCFTGVVSADLTLDRVDGILEQQWTGLRKDLSAEPWSYELLPNTSSIFIVNRASPRFPAQEGMLIGRSSDGGDEREFSARSGELTLATESESEAAPQPARARASDKV